MLHDCMPRGAGLLIILPGLDEANMISMPFINRWQRIMTMSYQVRGDKVEDIKAKEMIVRWNLLSQAL